MTFIRQCAWCLSIWDPSKKEWVEYSTIMNTATHTICEKCQVEQRLLDAQETTPDTH